MNDSRNFICSDCALNGCTQGDFEKTPSICPCHESEIQAQARALYNEEENNRLALAAARVEAAGYGRQCRMEEIMAFANRMNYHRLGLVFCMGLKKEAAMVTKILRAGGFEVVSVICKNGGMPKANLGLTPEECLDDKGDEVMCNPIGQALLMNEAGVEFNILLGLCVGHDTLALKYLEAPTTVLAVKDRVACHNPLGPIYVAESYYKKKFFPQN